MNNSIKFRNSKEVTIQLKRAEVQKNILIKNIYKEYEIYFKIIRNSIMYSAERGIFGLYSDLSISDRVLNTSELINFLNKNISLLIHSKLPLLTIEQLKLGDISDPQKQFANLNPLKEFVEFKEYQAFDFDYENELKTNEPLEFHFNNINSYQYYESHIEDELSSVNLDESYYLNSFSKQNNIKKIKYEKDIESSLEFIEESKDNKFNHHENLNDVYISNDDLNFFEIIDKAFSHFLFKRSYEINEELFKINLIKKFISEDTFKCLSNNNYITKHPHPFVIRYNLNLNKMSGDSNNSFDMFLLNISNVELEFYNLNLSNCRNNINELKNKFKFLNKKHRYWKNKELTLNNLN